MLLTLLAVTWLVVTVVAIVAVAVWPSRRLAVRQRVLVNLIDGKALQGVLWARRGRLLVLKDVTLLERGAEPTPMDGEVLVERSRVDFIQTTTMGG